MKKTIFILTALLLIAPAMAAVDINCVHTGSGVVEIRYDAAEDGNLPRGIGIEISVDSGAQITAVTDLSTDYWVHPGDINIVDGNVVDEGSPVVGTLPASSIILEMGSLHYPADVTSPNAPPSSGVLVEITVDADCNVTISGEADRGEVVNYEAEAAVAVYTGCSVTVAASWPACWGYLTQCHGDTDGDVDVDTVDWPKFRDSFGKSYPDAAYDACADFDRDGDVDTVDWPEFRDNFGGTPAADCTVGGTWPPL